MFKNIFIIINHSENGNFEAKKDKIWQTLLCFFTKQVKFSMERTQNISGSRGMFRKK
jgi:hypothetical protein